MATGTPARGAVSVPCIDLFLHLLCLLQWHPLRSTVTKLFTVSSFASIAARAASVRLHYSNFSRFYLLAQLTAAVKTLITTHFCASCLTSTRLRNHKAAVFLMPVHWQVSLRCPSPFVTTSSRNTLFTGNTWDIGSTPAVSSSFNLSI